jgi:hypothetical protein
VSFNLWFWWAVAGALATVPVLFFSLEVLMLLLPVLRHLVRGLANHGRQAIVGAELHRHPVATGLFLLAAAELALGSKCHCLQVGQDLLFAWWALRTGRPAQEPEPAKIGAPASRQGPPSASGLYPAD